MSTYKSFFFFFFNAAATTEIYTLSLHDALPIPRSGRPLPRVAPRVLACRPGPARSDRKSTRLNSSHSQTSYAVFCLKKKKHNAPLRPLRLGVIFNSSILKGTFHPVATFFFFNDTATTEIYTLSLHDALPI